MNSGKLDKEMISQPELWRLALIVSADRLDVALYPPLTREEIIWRSFAFDPDAPSQLRAIEDIIYANPLLLSDFKRVDCIIDNAVAMPLLSAVDSSVSSGLLGIAKLGGYMVFFNLLNICFVPFSDLPPFLPKLYNCMLEITSGIDRVGQSMPYLVLIMLPFGGFSCIAQTYSMICHTNLSIRPYVLHKLAQTGLTALIYLLLRPF